MKIPSIKFKKRNLAIFAVFFVLIAFMGTIFYYWFKHTPKYFNNNTTSQDEPRQANVDDVSPWDTRRNPYFNKKFSKESDILITTSGLVLTPPKEFALPYSIFDRDNYWATVPKEEQSKQKLADLDLFLKAYNNYKIESIGQLDTLSLVNKKTNKEFKIGKSELVLASKGENYFIGVYEYSSKLTYLITNEFPGYSYPSSRVPYDPKSIKPISMDDEYDQDFFFVWGRSLFMAIANSKTQTTYLINGFETVKGLYDEYGLFLYKPENFIDRLTPIDAYNNNTIYGIKNETINSLYFDLSEMYIDIGIGYYISLGYSPTSNSRFDYVRTIVIENKDYRNSFISIGYSSNRLYECYGDSPCSAIIYDIVDISENDLIPFGKDSRGIQYYTTGQPKHLDIHCTKDKKKFASRIYKYSVTTLPSDENDYCANVETYKRELNPVPEVHYDDESTAKDSQDEDDTYSQETNHPILFVQDGFGRIIRLHPR